MTGVLTIPAIAGRNGWTVAVRLPLTMPDPDPNAPTAFERAVARAEAICGPEPELTHPLHSAWKALLRQKTKWALPQEVNAIVEERKQLAFRVENNQHQAVADAAASFVHRWGPATTAQIYRVLRANQDAFEFPLPSETTFGETTKRGYGWTLRRFYAADQEMYWCLPEWTDEDCREAIQGRTPTPEKGD